MSTPHSSDERSRRQSILQGVYEENLGIEKARRERSSRTFGSSRRASWLRGSLMQGSLRVAAIAVIFFVAAVIGASYHFMPGVASPVAESDGSGVSMESSEPGVGEEGPLPFDAPREMAAGTALPGLVSGSDVSLAHLFGLKVRTIVIDPGHGGSEDGALGPSGLKEKAVALDVAHRLRQRLEAHGNYRILMTRERDEHVSLRERVEFANENGADLFISLHVNWLPVEEVTSIETYYFGTETTERALRTAERENRNADFSVAEFNDMIQQISQSMRVQESRRLASSIQNTLYHNMRAINENVADWGVKTAPFVVLLGVEAPSVLAEMAVISNAEEEQLLRSRDHRERLAESLEEGIIHYLDDRSSTTTAP